MDKNRIQKEAKRIEEDSLYSAKGHFVTASFWRRFHIWIGVPTAILAAISGASALSDFSNHTLIAGILAIIVTALTAVATFLNPNGRASSHLEAGNKYNSLRNRARIFREIGIDRKKPKNEPYQQLMDLNNKRDELNKKSPQPPKWAFIIARRGIEEGEANYEVDRK